MVLREKYGPTVRLRCTPSADDQYEPPTIDTEAGNCALADGSNLWSVERFQTTID